MRLVAGIVLEPEVVDAHGDICSADEIKKTAYNFMARYRGIKEMATGLCIKKKIPTLK